MLSDLVAGVVNNDGPSVVVESESDNNDYVRINAQINK